MTLPRAMVRCAVLRCVSPCLSAFASPCLLCSPVQSFEELSSEFHFKVPGEGNNSET